MCIRDRDTAGQERYQSLGSNFYKGSECCFLVYDITNAKSFEALDNWRAEFLKTSGSKCPDSFPFIVLGNKCDKEEERKVDREKGKEWAKSNAVAFFETSAKDCIEVEEAFMKAIEVVMQQRDAWNSVSETSKENIKISKKEVEKSNGCC
eukprot:TRINITY_DN5855_c0_g2_i3.p1 TRINITY_DN5855_c0_g2~~TRINITY_DN5855_c0_g2_i3.p1  ORF type:complete len:150 (+),score=52.86 TRINITY_DN5855_c0_g2_i3:73-522(+)